jgi:hypothetical protein
MKESYREGVANHPGPEPCESSREAALEALDRGICRLGIELRNRVLRGADGVGRSGRPQRGERHRERAASPRSRRPQSMQRNSMRENRETPLPLAGSWRAGGRRR